jgi:two-component system chemotaxis response regulator CheB
VTTDDDAPGGGAARVLIVTNRVAAGAALAAALAEGGCVVVGHATDGSTALRMVVQEDPDVISVDLDMPRMDGFTFLRVLKKTRDTPVIAIISTGRHESAPLALGLGARDVVVDAEGMEQRVLAHIRALAATGAGEPPPKGPPTGSPSTS